MIIQCKNCERKFAVKDSDIPAKGRSVRCGYCSVTWHQLPASKNMAKTKKISSRQPEVKENEALSVDQIKASDGKTYKFLGTQWAELLPSGKTGIFAKKKIGLELDKLTGRVKVKNTIKKQKTKKDLDPSSEILSPNKQEQNLYKEKGGLGFFGFIFLTIIVAFSLVGILKTFETDLINTFPEINYIFELLDTQLSYIAESVKNIIVIVQDLINSY